MLNIQKRQVLKLEEIKKTIEELREEIGQYIPPDKVLNITPELWQGFWSQKWLKRAEEIKGYENSVRFLREIIEKSTFFRKTKITIENFTLLFLLDKFEDLTLKDVICSFFSPEYFWRRFYKGDIYFAPKQLEILRKVEKKDFISIRSCTASGKSYTLGHLAVWWLLTRRPAQVLMTAPTSRQAMVILWQEFVQARNKLLKSKYLGEYVSSLPEPKKLTYYEGRWQIGEKRQLLCFSPKEYRPESIQGLHSPFLMVIVDEASGVEDVMFEAIDRILTGSILLKYILVSNPTKTRGYFYETQKDTSGIWEKIHISAFDSPNVILEWIENAFWKDFIFRKKLPRIASVKYKPLNIKIPLISPTPGLISLKDVVRYYTLYSPQKAKFKIDILGEFPEAADFGIVSQEEIRSCMVHNISFNINDDWQIGIDVGLSLAKTVFALRIGNSLAKLKIIEEKDFTKLYKLFLDFLREIPKPMGFSNHLIPIVIDRTSWGYGFYEILRSNGFNVDGFLGTDKPVKIKNREKYSNRRAEAFITFIEKLKRKEVILPNEPALLYLAFFDIIDDKRGLLLVSPKEEVLETLPQEKKFYLDVIDAIIYAFCPTLKGPYYPTREPKPFIDNLEYLWE